ncbi:hypothetical protein F383_12567 [Gossypium arboreum]|uniref:Uncharacterized protein n=1 Tax=Gossypium arboreum TaxID=29729 RepID=A0A0B0PTJ8_GOSAR|nr:hypothetical protein F383_12567 [Gossypium arboreum]
MVIYKTNHIPITSQYIWPNQMTYIKLTKSLYMP